LLFRKVKKIGANKTKFLVLNKVFNLSKNKIKNFTVLKSIKSLVNLKDLKIKLDE